MSVSYLLEIQGIEKSFTDSGLPVVALKGIDLQVKKGEFLAIQGPSGCGKSTLLSLIGLLDTATKGSYLLSGQNVRQLSRYQQAVLRNKHIGWIFQNFNLIGDMTALENVMLPLRYNQSLSKKEHKAKAMAALAEVEMAEKHQAYPGQLSGGQQQRVAIARALVNTPDLLLADEPTGNLDSDNAELIFNLLSQLQARGTTIIMVTHAPELAIRCTRQVSMRDGVVVKESHLSSQASAEV